MYKYKLDFVFMLVCNNCFNELKVLSAFIKPKKTIDYIQLFF